MRNVRTPWLARLVVTSLAIVAAVFVAHLGAEGHTDECQACEIAAVGFAEPVAGSPSLDSGPCAFAAVAADDLPFAAATRLTQGPRAPPAS